MFSFYYSSISKLSTFRQLYRLFKKSKPKKEEDECVSSKGDLFEMPQQTEHVGICIQNIHQVSIITLTFAIIVMIKSFRGEWILIQTISTRHTYY